MVRVIYRWRVERSHQDDFVSWWHDGTLRIRASQPGALGSTLVRSTDDDDIFVGLARWTSRDRLTEFWEGMRPVPFDGAVMESLEILEEVDHLTLEEPSGVA